MQFDDSLSQALYRLRDWVYEKYHTAYVLGTAALCYWVTFPSLQAFIVTWFVCIALGALIEPCVNPYNDRYGASLWKGEPRSDPRVALTFDDGPCPVVTPRLLDLLAEADVKATFFLIGERAEQYPELARRILEEGHLVGNHTQHHPNLLLCSPAAGRHEIATGAASIHSATGQPVEYFRPPYGFRFPWTFKQARALGQTPVLWSVNPCDFHDPGPQEICRRVMESVAGGSIVLLHDGPRERSQTLEAVASLIGQLRERGYQLVRVDQL